MRTWNPPRWFGMAANEQHRTMDRGLERTDPLSRIISRFQEAHVFGFVESSCRLGHPHVVWSQELPGWGKDSGLPLLRSKIEPRRSAWTCFGAGLYYTVAELVAQRLANWLLPSTCRGSESLFPEPREDAWIEGCPCSVRRSGELLCCSAAS